MKKSKIFKTLAVAGACLCAPLVLSGCVKENSSKVDFRVKDGYIQVTEDGKNWKNLIDIDDLKGEPGLPGENGVGIDGKEVEFQVADGWIQWKYTIDTEWTNLIELEELKGEDGEDAVAPTIYIGGNGNWIINGEDTGVKAEAVNGETGNGIQNVTIDPNKSDVTKTTYVITFTDNTTFEFEVYNGEDGEDAVAPTITIGENGNWFINGEDTGVKAEGRDGENAEAEQYTIKYDYGTNGVASEFFQTAPTSETIKSTQWLTTLPEIKDEYNDGFKGWFIQGTDKQIENYDFIGGDVTLEARFHINEYAPAGLYYDNGIMYETWDDLIDLDIITVDGTTFTRSRSMHLQNFGAALVINNSIDTIGEGAFTSCNFVEIIIPNSVTTIGEEAFISCESLTNITIPNSVTTIGYRAFASCSELTEITIPSSVTTIGDLAFGGCTGLESIIVDSGNSVYRSESNCIIKGNELILGCKNSTIPSSVTTIGNYAFYNCAGLTEINIPSSVTSIGDYAFEGCTGLTTITIPNSVTSIGKAAFRGCAGLTEIAIPNSVTSIGDYAFEGCTGLESITVDSGNADYRSAGNCLIIKSNNELILGCKTSVIPNSVTTIGYRAFASCSELTEITIPSSVTSIDDWAFMGCTGLERITVDSGNSVYRSEGNCLIKGNELILGCKNSIIPNSVTTIGAWAFDKCAGLTEITIPSSVTTIGAFAFYNCAGLKTVVIDSATIANNLTDVAYYNNGALLSNATTVYIKAGLDVSDSTYLASHFTKQSTSDMDDYDKYVLN